MTHIRIDRQAKTLELELELEGETTPLRIQVDNYTFEKSPDGQGRLSVSGLRISRAWMQFFLRKFAEGQTVTIPPDMAEYAGLIL